MARYVVRDPVATTAWTTLIEKHPTRLLSARTRWRLELGAYAMTHSVYQPLWERLDGETRAQVERLNHERVFDAAVPMVRVRERAAAASR